MAIDYEHKERAFLAALIADTGRDLTGWMEAIRETGLQDRNAIIDWLRAQGFMFSKASWLERIHHNGGRPVYATRRRARRRYPDGGAADAPIPFARPPAHSPPPAVSGQTHVADSPQDRRAPPNRPALRVIRSDRDTPVPAPPHVAPSPQQSEPHSAQAANQARAPIVVDNRRQLDSLLAEAKAYRPLAQYLLAEISKAVAGLRLLPRPGYVAIATAKEFAVLAISPRDLRLALACATAPPPALFGAVRFPKALPQLPPVLTHMIILTDARQVTPELLDMIRSAAGP